MQKYNGPQAMDDAERKAHIERVNKASHMAGLMMKSKSRHERRHAGKKGTTLEQRREYLKTASQ